MGAHGLLSCFLQALRVLCTASLFLKLQFTFFFSRWQHIQSKSHKAALHRLAARNSLHIKKYARDYIPSNYSHITHCHQRHTQNLHGFFLASQDLNPSTTTPLPSPTLDFALRAGQAEGARVQA